MYSNLYRVHIIFRIIPDISNVSVQINVLYKCIIIIKADFIYRLIKIEINIIIKKLNKTVLTMNYYNGFLSTNLKNYKLLLINKMIQEI